MNTQTIVDARKGLKRTATLPKSPTKTKVTTHTTAIDSQAIPRKDHAAASSSVAELKKRLKESPIVSEGGTAKSYTPAKGSTVKPEKGISKKFQESQKSNQSQEEERERKSQDPGKD